MYEYPNEDVRQAVKQLSTVAEFLPPRTRVSHALDSGNVSRVVSIWKSNDGKIFWQWCPEDEVDMDLHPL